MYAHEIRQEARRILQMAEHRRRGLWTFCQRNKGVELSLALAEESCSLDHSAKMEAGIIRMSGNGAQAFRRYFDSVITDITSFQQPECHPLFWALAKASHFICEQQAQKTHEPELNGAFMAAISSAIRDSRGNTGSRSTVQDCIGLHFSDHHAEGNESLTGADFGVIVQRPTEQGPRYQVALVQAKRVVTNRVYYTASEREQLNELRKRRIGYYVFYNQFDHGHGINIPTVRAADEIGTELDHDTSIDPEYRAYDFPSFVTFGMAGAASLCGEGTSSAEEALTLLFDPGIPGITINHVLVNVMASHRYDLEEIASMEDDWMRLIEEARYALRQGYPPFHRGHPHYDYLDAASEQDIIDLENANGALTEQIRQQELSLRRSRGLGQRQERDRGMER